MLCNDSMKMDGSLAGVCYSKLPEIWTGCDTHAHLGRRVAQDSMIRVSHAVATH